MFRMYGRKVEILKYQVSYQENEEQRTDYTMTEDEANEIAERVNGTVTALESEDDAWMDGIEVDDVPDTYAEAMRIYQLGESAYKEALKKPKDEARLAALESAMLAIMMGGISNV